MLKFKKKMGFVSSEEEEENTSQSSGETHEVIEKREIHIEEKKRLKKISENEKSNFNNDRRN